MEQYLNGIKSGRDIRHNLILLRQELKKEESKRSLAYLLGGDFHIFTDLLKHEDPKVRKNTARILGEMETEDVLPWLFSAYQGETTLFVRSDYLKAMEKLDYRQYLEKLRSRLDVLEHMEIEEENRKHLREETLALRDMILKYEKPKKHVFIGYQPAPEVILVTNRLCREVVRNQITAGEVKEMPLGLRVKNGDLRELLALRTWSEVLFPVPGSIPLDADPVRIGIALSKMHLAEFLEDLHKQGGSFYYRVEVKGSMPLEKRGSFIRKIAEVLDGESNGRLRNTASDYEAELRLIQRRDGTFLPLIKLYTLPDHRFDYRRETVAASISPVNAALTVALAQNYLKDGAQVLDPFCGVGTMLLERNKAVHADPMYGVDLFGEAIEKARRNTERDKSVVHYINRDFFDFTHSYLFDEIITDMPRFADEEETRLVYNRFFDRAGMFLKKQAVLVLYTLDPGLVQENLERHEEYLKKEHFLLNEKNGASVFVLSYARG